MNLWNIVYAVFWVFAGAVIVGILLTSRERAGRRGREPKGCLSFAGAPPVDIVGEAELREALKRLDGVEDGGSVRLSESESHYIEAARRGQLWSADLKTGRFWTSMRFDAQGTSHYSEWEVRRSRAAGPKGPFMRSTPSHEALSTDQVRSLFVAYLLGSPYPLGGGGD